MEIMYCNCLYYRPSHLLAALYALLFSFIIKFINEYYLLYVNMFLANRKCKCFPIMLQNDFEC